MDAQLGLFGDEMLAEPPPGVGAVTPSKHVRALARRLPPTLRLGTSSWSFPGWDGIVYDRRTSQRMLAREGLPAYAEHPLFRTVGVDRTYYRPLEVADFREYAAVVPDDFRFLVKADRLVTSPLDPETPGVRARNPRFLDPSYAVDAVVAPFVEGLGAKAGVLLFQFPPIPANLVRGRQAFQEQLQRFLAALPEGPLYAVELRTPAFLDESYADVLESVGVAHCYNVHPAMAPIERQLALVQPFYQPALVVRWMLHSGLRYEAARDRYAPFDRLVDEDPESRDRIATTVLDVILAERPAFVIANNKAEGSSPLTLIRLAERICGWTPASAD
ncbi:MAG: DUF72 domain-containing protein [Gemmatimonadota bacterium]|jgi:uncharacterized protein YecE (DUF72 family)